MRILLTGGLGYIGSNTAVELLNYNHEVAVIDNLSNSSLVSLNEIKAITNKNFTFYNSDLLSLKSVQFILKDFMPDAIIHLAGHKSISESFSQTITYYQNNVSGTLNLLQAMEETRCNHILFSSTASVYDATIQAPPFAEGGQLKILNPYSSSKYIVEQILENWVLASNSNKATVLRYFNPVGAHPSLLLGERSTKDATNLMPLVCNVATGSLKELKIYGNDYETKDGTGVRDYIHVSDLATAHVHAIQNHFNLDQFEILNVGMGVGVSVLEIIDTFETANGIQIPYRFAERRNGDASISVADVERIKVKIGWEASRSLRDMCIHSYGFAVNQVSN